MKQILQNLKTGELDIAEVPAPAVRPGQLLIRTRCSVISAGTERMLVNFARSHLLDKARQQPDKVRQVMDKIKAEGLLPTMSSVLNRLDEPLPLGYCNCGEVVAVGAGVEGFGVGDRVANNGPHADLVCVPKNLCARVPENVTDEQGAFTVAAAISLQGIRLLGPGFGETVVVFGLGLLGLIAVQLLVSSGCRVIGIDLDAGKLEKAREFGAEVIEVSGGSDAVLSAMAMTEGKGVDGVLITASARSDIIVQQSARMSRQRGRIVLVGVVDLALNRADFYEKELTFQVSCSYGPGRYDPRYEQGGQDYPYGFVRWTEQRNFAAVLDGLAAGSLAVDELISDRFEIAQAKKAYDLLTADPDKLALVLTYPREGAVGPSAGKVVFPRRSGEKATAEAVVLGLIGAGNFARTTLLPAIKGAGVRLKAVADIDGAAGAHTARKFGFEEAVNDYQDLLRDDEINTLIIATRHDLHAKMVIESLRAGKHTAVEKPLCLSRRELSEIRDANTEAGDRQLLVGFNRRFSPHARKMKELLAGRIQPLCMSMMVNAGEIPPDVWVHDKAIGGGRIIGEGVHWIDLMAYLSGAPAVTVQAVALAKKSGILTADDKTTIVLTFADGSIGTLHYFANGHRGYPKETLELFCENKILKLDNFRSLKGYGWPQFKSMNLFNQDKGHQAEYTAFFQRIAAGGPPLVPFEELENITLAGFAAVEAAEQKEIITF